MSANSSSQSLSVKTRRAGKQKVVRGILRGLMEGSWKGNDRITEVSAVESFGVSRTPVREALLELQGLGLIELRRNCGAVVLPFGTRELGEIYAVRSLLETEATRLAAKAFAADVIGYLIEQFHEIQSTGGIDPDWELDRDLHSRIADFCGNRRLTAEIERYGELIQTIRDIVGEQTKGIHLTSAEEHLAILEGLRKRNPEMAAAAMRNHLSHASESAISAMEAMRG